MSSIKDQIHRMLLSVSLNSNIAGEVTHVLARTTNVLAAFKLTNEISLLFDINYSTTKLLFQGILSFIAT